jgi:ribonuclease P protein component
MSIPREHRLRKHAEFELVYKSGRRHVSPILTAFYLLRRPEESESGSVGRSEEPRIGITVGGPLGKATARNRIKRRVRAAVTQNLERIKRPVDVVINPKKVVQEIDFQQLCAEVARAFDTIQEKAAPPQKENQRQERTGSRSMAVRKN